MRVQARRSNLWPVSLTTFSLRSSRVCRTSLCAASGARLSRGLPFAQIPWSSRKRPRPYLASSTEASQSLVTTLLNSVTISPTCQGEAGLWLTPPSTFYSQPTMLMSSLNTAAMAFFCVVVRRSLHKMKLTVVCNPATEKWTVLPKPEKKRGRSTMYLGFDPTVSSHFTVFVLTEFTHGMLDNEIDEEDPVEDWHHQIRGVNIYSSQTGRWTYHQSQWGDKSVQIFSSGIFYNGALHVTTLDSSVNTVDTEGKTWTIIPTPYYYRFMGMSQGHLYAVHRRRYSSQLSIWILEDYGGKKWSLKQNINSVELFGANNIFFEDGFPPHVIAIHPESSLVFMILGLRKNFVSYNMDTRKVQDICNLAYESVHPYLPYIPCFSGWFSDGH